MECRHYDGMTTVYSTAKLIWKLIFNKEFRHWFWYAFDYAIRNADEKRGEGSSDVILFRGRGYYAQIAREIEE